VIWEGKGRVGDVIDIIMMPMQIRLSKLLCCFGCDRRGTSEMVHAWCWGDIRHLDVAHFKSQADRHDRMVRHVTDRAYLHSQQLNLLTRKLIHLISLPFKHWQRRSQRTFQD
jgi:hypothetical protein